MWQPNVWECEEIIGPLARPHLLFVAHLLAVDNRLFRIAGRRVVRLRKEDIPQLARAIIAVVRNRAKVGVVRVKNVDYVNFQGRDVDALVLRSDWEKILPFVQEEAFNPQIVPVEPPGRYSDPDIAYEEPVLDRADRFLYNSVVGILTGLFEETFPTSPF